MKFKCLILSCLIVVIAVFCLIGLHKFFNVDQLKTRTLAANTANLNIPTPNNLNTSNRLIETNSAQPQTSQWIENQIAKISPQAPNLNPDVLKTSLIAYQHAEEKGITNNPIITVVDYSKPSTERRLWVINLDTQRVLFNTWVAHGKNSGATDATSFSNKPQSLKSSIGVFVTENVYTGKHGTSLRVKGLEPGVNDNAYDRSIVFHGASYVSESIAKNGRLGRSWGCWAVSYDTIHALIKTIKNNSLLIAYYPDKKWLAQSYFLN